MRSARNFESGMDMVRQLEYGLFDMRVHSALDPGGGTPQEILDAVRREVAVAPRPAYDRFIHTFGHIFAGGYAAGFYSYKWAEVLSADAFSLFEEGGSSRRRPAPGSARKCSPGGAAGRHWSHLWPFAAALHK
jgi:oligopeptidase A